MAKQDAQPRKTEEDKSQAPTPAILPRQVTVTHLDAPPSSGKEGIHPRRPAPVVPSREERTDKRPAGDSDNPSRK